MALKSSAKTMPAHIPATRLSSRMVYQNKQTFHYRELSILSRDDLTDAFFLLANSPELNVYSAWLLMPVALSTTPLLLPHSTPGCAGMWDISFLWCPLSTAGNNCTGKTEPINVAADVNGLRYVRMRWVS